ncbi:hypothetical protein [Alteriqipengyuania lutimaris]|uniref:hypothetical protein n=1 Tax=Alteriqipengyuania lutimaris TaxID=1538146 RepID=UPI0017C5D81A|nr:hypothetical protein [Alteriqipengyuania lutimaris]MBB3034261.1 hypothetical protein [Alteriqipengyuania lutimaris]
MTFAVRSMTRWLAALAIVAAGSPTFAQVEAQAGVEANPRVQLPAVPAPEVEATRAPLPEDVAQLRAQDARVLVLGYRLLTGNARYCEDATSSAGLLLHDMAAYGAGDRLRRVLGLTGDVGVQALVPGGPAERAGVVVDDTVLAIGAMRIADIATEGAEPWERIETIRAEAERLLAQTGRLPITVMRSEGPATIEIDGVPACRSRFEIGEGGRAVADGHRIVIGPDFAGIDYPDPLLAAVLSHELAHNLLRHRAWFDANGGRKRKAVRLTEREADRLMPWLLANAGFDPRAAMRFFEEWGPRHGGWIFRARTHDGWDERVEFIEAELPLIESLQQSERELDWAQHFSREELPGSKRATR